MKKLVSLSLSILITALVASDGSAQQLRNVARQVDASVVVIKTVENLLVAASEALR